MSDIVFVLGAGASAQAGGPVMSNFLTKARALRDAGELSEEEETHFDRVFAAKGKLQAVHSKAKLDFENIERLFATFEMADLIDRFPGLEGDGRLDGLNTDDLISSLKYLIEVTLERTIEFNKLSKYRPQGAVETRSGGKSYVNLPFDPPTSYNAFKRLLFELENGSPVQYSTSVLTFNYDLALDYTFYHGSTSGRGKGAEMRQQPPFNQPANYSLGNQSGGYTLLKLHGSLNWGYCKECEKVVPWPLRKWPWTDASLRSPSDQHLRIGRELGSQTHDCGSHLEPSPVIVPPTWSKSAQHSRLSEVWAQAAQEMSEAKHIVVIGYSLPESDAFFRYLYGLGTVGDEAIRSFVVCDPYPKGVEERFRNLLGPGVTLSGKFDVVSEDFAQSVVELRNRFDTDQNPVNFAL